jgi:hypothetical protein
MSTPEVEPDSTSSSTPTSSRPRRRLWRGLLGTLVVIVISLVVRQIYWHSRVADELERAVQELDATEPGWQLADLEAARPVPPDKDNSALVAQSVARMLTTHWPPSDFERLPDDLEPQRLLDEKRAAALRAERDGLHSALAEARKLEQMPTGHFPHQVPRGGLTTRLDPEFQTRRIVTLLKCDAVVRCQDRDLTGASLDCRAIRNLARSMDDELFTFSQLTPIAELIQMCRTLERVLAQGEVGAKELELLQGLLEEEATCPRLERMARGERAVWHEALDALEAGDSPLSSLDIEPRSWMERWAPWVVRANVREQHAAMLPLLNDFVALSRLPETERLAAMAQFQKRIALMPAGIARTAFVPLIKVEDAIRRNEAYLRCTFTALAVERYRDRQHKWPDRFDALVPTFLSSVPRDPYDGAPLRYLNTDHGVVVYSVSRDGVDNGGRIDHSAPTSSGNDLGIRLWGPQHRRQPAAKSVSSPK